MNLPSGPREGAPTPSQYSGAAAAPSVRFDVIGEAFQMFKDAPVPWVVGTLALAAVYILGGVIGYVTHVALLQSLVQICASYLVMGGLFAMAIKQARGEAITLNDMRDSLPVFGSLVLLGVITTVITILSMVTLCIGPVVVSGLTMLAVPAIVDQRVSATDALRISFRALKSQWFQAVVLLLGLGLLIVVSLLVIVGPLVTFPIYVLAIAITYRDLVLAPMAYAQAPAGYGAAPLPVTPQYSLEVPQPAQSGGSQPTVGMFPAPTQPTMAMPSAQPAAGLASPPPLPPQSAPGMPASSPPQPPAAPGEAPLAPPLPPPPPPMP